MAEPRPQGWWVQQNQTVLILVIKIDEQIYLIVIIHVSLFRFEYEAPINSIHYYGYVIFIVIVITFKSFLIISNF